MFRNSLPVSETTLKERERLYKKNKKYLFVVLVVVGRAHIHLGGNKD